jgi:hypothetical protein
MAGYHPLDAACTDERVDVEATLLPSDDDWNGLFLRVGVDWDGCHRPGPYGLDERVRLVEPGEWVDAGDVDLLALRTESATDRLASGWALPG